ncbi:MAG: branched-chain amino acid ABC transporter permease [Alphaproteobacteria bacterium]|nr:branched-chain amino acid ABC transporter permease [Alphaproteobacteria bacterium]
MPGGGAMTELVIQGALSGLLIGGVYGLIALGLNLVFGTMRVVNFAQGTLLMVAMFMSYWLTAKTGLHPYLTPLLTLPALFGLGYLIQLWLVSPLLAREKAREPMSVLLMTLGLSLVLENSALMAFSADYKTVQVGQTNAVWFIGDYIISIARFWGLLAMASTVALLWAFLTRTDLGRAIRAVGQDRQVARLLGIDDRVIYNFAFGISTAIMGIAAAALLPFYYTHPAVGTTFLLKAFVIVVLGGLGSMPGAALGGLAVGVIEGVVGIFTEAAMAQIVLFAVFVTMLFFRPAGLLGVERK